MFVGHVAVVTEVIVIAHSALPADTAQSALTTNVTVDVPMTNS